MRETNPRLLFSIFRNERGLILIESILPTTNYQSFTRRARLVLRRQSICIFIKAERTEKVMQDDVKIHGKRP
jgi:hypothetical protein